MHQLLGGAVVNDLAAYTDEQIAGAVARALHNYDVHAAVRIVRAVAVARPAFAQELVDALKLGIELARR